MTDRQKRLIVAAFKVVGGHWPRRNGAPRRLLACPRLQYVERGRRLVLQGLPARNSQAWAALSRLLHDPMTQTLLHRLDDAPRLVPHLGGGADRIAKQHEAGKLTARERIEKLLLSTTDKGLIVPGKQHISMVMTVVLGIAGALMQGHTRNPLGDPGRVVPDRTPIHRRHLRDRGPPGRRGQRPRRGHSRASAT